jgi:hypothetical protein
MRSSVCVELSSSVVVCDFCTFFRIFFFFVDFLFFFFNNILVFKILSPSKFAQVPGLPSFLTFPTL